MKILNAWRHFRTITEHKLLVMRECFQVGLYRQGLLHDLSKYSWEEFSTGVRYYQGNRSPNAAEKEVLGYSGAWLHHKGRNKHHFEYWIDFAPDKSQGLIGNKMPLKYVIEMVMDRIAASKVYKGKDYKRSDRDPSGDEAAFGKAPPHAERQGRSLYVCLYTKAPEKGNLLKMGDQVVDITVGAG